MLLLISLENVHIYRSKIIILNEIEKSTYYVLIRAVAEGGGGGGARDF